jgi:hypothetical protein
MLPITEKMSSEAFSIPGDDILHPDAPWQVPQQAHQHDMPSVQKDALPHDGTGASYGLGTLFCRCLSPEGTY